MFGLGWAELLIILAILVLIFGAGKLPQVGSSFGKAINNFKKGMKESKQESKLPEAELADNGEVEKKDKT